MSARLQAGEAGAQEGARRFEMRDDLQGNHQIEAFFQANVERPVEIGKAVSHAGMPGLESFGQGVEGKNREAPVAQPLAHRAGSAGQLQHARAARQQPVLFHDVHGMGMKPLLGEDGNARIAVGRRDIASGNLAEAGDAWDQSMGVGVFGEDLDVHAVLMRGNAGAARKSGWTNRGRKSSPTDAATVASTIAGASQGMPRRKSVP